MINAPDISVVIPVHNAERFLGEAVASVLAQKGFSKEIILVDNNSTDRSREVAESLEGPIIVTSESQPGAGAARNCGVSLATGRYLAFLDADDLWLAGKVEKQVRALSAGNQLSFTYAREFPDERYTGSPCRSEPYPFLAPSTFLALRSTVLRLGPLPEIPGGEFIAWYGWAQALGMKTSMITEVCAMRRVHENNSSRSQAVMGSYPQAAKWVLERRRQAQQTPAA
ncbi:MAG: glycosyltransferase [Bryobacteraceae bacterium]